MIYCGIDPGKRGGIVTIDDKLNILHKAVVPLIGAKEIDVPLFTDQIKKCRGDITVMEKVSSIHGSSSKSNFTFGRVVGILEGVLYSTKTSFLQVTPRQWQKIAWQGVTPIKQGNKVDTKATSLVAARRLFPQESFLATQRSKVPHDGLVDAALMAYVALRNHS